MPSLSFAAMPLWLALLRGPLLQHPARFALSVLAIALGVALGLAVRVINASAVDEFAAASRALSGEADLVVRGAREGFDEALYPVLARTPGVQLASPVIEVDAPLADSREVLHVMGIDLFRALALQPGLVGEGTDRLDLLRPDTVFLSPMAAASLGLSVGGTLRVQAGVAVRELRVVGSAGGEAARGRWAIMDIAAAQTLFGREGLVSRVDLRLDPEVDVATVLAGLSLPPGVVAERPDAGAQTTARMTRAYRVNLEVLALVALFTGGLLVLTTQALAVAQRRAQIALLRVIGFTRRQVVLLLASEGLVVGVLGALAGTLIGLVAARLILGAFGGDLGAGFYDAASAPLRVDGGAIALFALLGVGAALAGSLAPAFEVARAAPAQALKSGDDQRAFSALRPAWPGLLAIGLGVAMTRLPPVGGLPVFGYLAIVALLGGTLALLPRIARLVAMRLPVTATDAASLAVARLRAYPTQAALSVAAVVAAVSLVTAMAIMVASFRHSLDEWLGAMLPADLYLRAATDGDAAFLSPELQQAIRATPGLERVEFLRWQQVLTDPALPRTTVLARDGVAGDAALRLPLVSGPVAGPTDLPQAWLSEPASTLLNLVPGDRLTLPLDGREHVFHVAGIWRDYARQNGAVLVDRDVYRRLTGDATANDAGLWMAPGVGAGEIIETIRRLPGVDRMVFATPLDIRALSLSIFDRTFAVTYALEAAAVVIGLLGLSSAIGGQVISRRREFGMLRHLGVTRRQIATMLAAEGLTATAAGLLVGYGLGFAIGLVLIHVVNRQSFHWGMELQMPWSTLAIFGIAMLASAAITSVVSGRRALATDAVRAVREDW